MEIYQDRVEVYVLPEYAKCKADQYNRNPLYMDVCPYGFDICVEGCDQYEEEYENE